MTLHGALSILADVSAGMEENLANLLQQIETDPGHNPLIPFATIKSIHFSRFLICPARLDPKGNPIPCRLIFTTDYDQPLDDHLQELMQQAGPGLWKIFSHCDGFPLGKFDKQALSRFLEARAIKTNTFYRGVGNRSVTQIRQENELRTDIQQWLDRNRTRLLSTDAKEIREEIRHFVSASPGSTWAKEPDPVSTTANTLSKALDLVLVIIGFIILSPILIPFALIWLLIILYMELTGINAKCTIEKQHLESLIIRETGIVQNQFSAFGNVKPGGLRYHTMVFLLKLTDFLAPYLFNKGALSGIPTVHFARWLIISQGRQMLFLSNYDGNSEGYLKDFIDIAAKQLTLLFSHTIGYPKTWLMVFGGAKDANGFMAWARQNQLVTNVWYSANPSVSVKNVYQNSKIRSGLYGAMSEKQSRKWLRLF